MTEAPSTDPSTGWIMLPPPDGPTPPQHDQSRHTPLHPPPLDPNAEREAYAELLKAFAEEEDGTVVTSLAPEEFAEESIMLPANDKG